MNYTCYKHIFQNGEILFSATNKSETDYFNYYLAFNVSESSFPNSQRMYYLIPKKHIEDKLIHIPSISIGAPINNLIKIEKDSNDPTPPNHKDELILEDITKRTKGFDRDYNIYNEFFKRIK